MKLGDLVKYEDDFAEITGIILRRRESTGAYEWEIMDSSDGLLFYAATHQLKVISKVDHES